MTSRELPPDEWYKLADTEAGPIVPSLNPQTTRVLVVEDGDEIVGSWVLLQVVHAECVWIRPSHRARFGVVSRLLRGMSRIASDWGARRVVTGAVSPEVTDLITRLGGVPMPCASFVLPVRMTMTDRERGHQFHEQLAALVPEDVHPDDAEHDTAVGRALRVAIDDGDPARAADEYNAWATGAGYVPVRFLGTHDGRLRVDIMTAVIDVDNQYAIRVCEDVCHS